MKKSSRHLLYRYLLPYGGLLMVKILSLTYRLDVSPNASGPAGTSPADRFVFASWHQRFFPGITFFSAFKPIAIMISQSRDGEFIARITRLLGWQPVRGSSSRGGSEAVRSLKRLAAKGCHIGHIVDGPKGPFGVVKPGLIRIAQVVGYPIVPVIISAQKRWVFNSWDRFMIPKPFSRVIIRFGEPIEVPSRMDSGQFEALRSDVEKQMKQLYTDTDRLWGEPDREPTPPKP